MPTKKKPTTKKSSPKITPKNPTDPNLLARDVMEAFLGEPLKHAISIPIKKPSSRKLTKKK